METTYVIEIIKVEYVEHYILKLFFSDNTSQIINFEPFLSQNHNPLTRKYTNIINFQSYKIEFGDLIWGDYELCFPIWELHEGKI